MNRRQNRVHIGQEVSTGTAPTVVVLTVSREELGELVREAVREALAECRPSPTPPTARLTIAQLAEAERCSRATINRLVREGAPVHYSGDSPRFDLAEWRAWNDERARREACAPRLPAHRELIPGVRLLTRVGRRDG
jgi:hypothetical protein